MGEMAASLRTLSRTSRRPCQHQKQQWEWLIHVASYMWGPNFPHHLTRSRVVFQRQSAGCLPGPGMAAGEPRLGLGKVTEAGA